MSPALLRLLAALMLLFVAGLADAAPADLTKFPGACTGNQASASHEWEDRQFEAPCIAKTGGTVRRDGKVLSIVKDAVVVRFTDIDGCGGHEDCAEGYALRDYYPDLGLYVVQNSHSEGFGFIVVDGRTGRQSRMPEAPDVSPDKRTLVSISPSEAFNWNGIEVWSITPEGLSRTLKYAPKVYGLYDFRRWRGNDRVEMNLYARVGKDLKDIPSELVRTPGGWRIVQKEYPRQDCRPDLPAPAASNASLASEKSRMSEGGNAVARAGNTLRIRMNTGETRAFADGACGAFCSYRYRGRLDTTGLDVLSRFRESTGLDTILVDRRTGAQTEVAGMPDFALDFSTFAVVAGTAVEVWTVGRGGFVRQARVEDAGRYCFAGWEGLDRLMLGARVPGEPLMAEAALARGGDGAWVKTVAGFPDGVVPNPETRFDRTARSVCRRQPADGAKDATTTHENDAESSYEAACVERLPGLIEYAHGRLVLSLADGRTLVSDRTVKDCPKDAPLPCAARLIDYDPAADAFLLRRSDGEKQTLTVDRRSGAVTPRMEAAAAAR